MITSPTAVTIVQDASGDPSVTMIEPDGTEGRTRMIWVAGCGYTAEVDDNASFEEIERLLDVMDRCKLTYAERDEYDEPLPAMDADDGLGFKVYYLMETE